MVMYKLDNETHAGITIPILMYDSQAYAEWQYSCKSDSGIDNFDKVNNIN